MLQKDFSKDSLIDYIRVDDIIHVVIPYSGPYVLASLRCSQLGSARWALGSAPSWHSLAVTIHDSVTDRVWGYPLCVLLTNDSRGLLPLVHPRELFSYFQNSWVTFSRVLLNPSPSPHITKNSEAKQQQKYNNHNASKKATFSWCYTCPFLSLSKLFLHSF